MTVDLNKVEIAACIVALGAALHVLDEGRAAARRLNVPVDDNAAVKALRDVKAKLEALQ